MDIKMYERILDICINTLAVIKFDDLSGCNLETKKRLSEEEEFRILNTIYAYCDYKEAKGEKVF